MQEILLILSKLEQTTQEQKEPFSLCGTEKNGELS